MYMMNFFTRPAAPAPKKTAPSIKVRSRVDGKHIATLERKAGNSLSLSDIPDDAEGNLIYPFVLSSEALALPLGRHITTTNALALRHLGYHLGNKELVEKADKWVQGFVQTTDSCEQAFTLLRIRRQQEAELEQAVQALPAYKAPFLVPEPGLFQPLLPTFQRVIQDILETSKEQRNAAKKAKLQDGSSAGQGAKRVLDIFSKLAELGEGYLIPILEGLSAQTIDFLYLESLLEDMYTECRSKCPLVLARADVSPSPQVQRAFVCKLMESLDQTRGSSPSVTRCLCNLLLFVHSNPSLAGAAELGTWLSRVKTELAATLATADYATFKALCEHSVPLLLEVVRLYAAEQARSGASNDGVASHLDRYMKEAAAYLDLQNFKDLAEALVRENHNNLLLAIQEWFRCRGLAEELFDLVDVFKLSDDILRDIMSTTSCNAASSFPQRLLAANITLLEKESAKAKQEVAELRSAVKTLRNDRAGLKSRVEVMEKDLQAALEKIQALAGASR